MIRIHKNESPYRSLTDEELQEIIVKTSFNQYGDDEYKYLAKVYGDFYGLDPALISFANGSDEWIQKCMMVLGRGPVMTFEPDFSMYEEYADQLKRPIYKVDCNEDGTFDYAGTLKQIEKVKPSFFIFSQPNNPLGMLHSDEFVQSAADLMQELNGYLIIDEAYMDFAEQKSVCPEGDHVIVLRTLSKIHGLAGLRIGIATSSSATMSLLNSVAHPYPINTLSINIAAYLFENQPKLEVFMEHQKKLAEKLKAIFKKEVGDVMNVLPSQANFVFTYGEAALELGQYIEQRGFQPRIYPDSSHPLLQKAVRYSLATDEQLTQLESILKEWRARI